MNTSNILIIDVYRGILLSYSTHAKHVICQDLFHAQLYDERNYRHDKTLDLSGKDSSGPIEDSVEYSSGPIEDSGEEANKNIKESEIDPTMDSRVTDDPTNRGNPTHALVVKKLTIRDRALPDEEDIFFHCAIKDIRSRIPDEKMYLLSYAFLSRWFYVSTLDNKHENHASLRNYMSISPEYVNLDSKELEEKYVKMRETMGR